MDSAVSVHRLRIFRAVAERRSFTLAAADLSTTQPAVSRVIQLLELAVGTSLFNRQPGAVALTEAGERVYDYALTVLSATDDLEQSLAFAQEIGSWFWTRNASALLASVYIERGDLAQAEALLTAAPALDAPPSALYAAETFTRLAAALRSRVTGGKYCT